jgi:HD-GYP domain-containing protein (c-di-GMP phosphodiesterase class II)
MHATIENDPKKQVESIADSATIETARAVARTRSFDDGLQSLEREGLLAAQVLRMKERYESTITIDLSLRPHDWEMLTILELYDVETFEHSLRVYQSAVAALERPLTFDDGSPLQLNEYLAEEGVSKRDFLYAALFHDIGKTMVPYRILKDKTTKEEFDLCFCDQVTERGEEWLQAIGVDPTADATEALEELYKQHRRPIDVLPLNEVLDAETFLELQARYPQLHLTEETTFREVLMLHEKESERILKQYGEIISGTIAGQHHNYAMQPLVYPRSTSTLRLARAAARSKVSAILHIVDVSDAIKNARSYKEAQSDYRVLFELMADTNAGKIDPSLAHAWVRAEYESLIGNEEAKQLTAAELAAVTEFLATPIASEFEVV